MTIAVPLSGLDRRKRPPPSPKGAQQWLRAHVIATRTDAVLAVLLLLVAAWYLPSVLRWAFIDSTVFAETPAECRAVTGACWAVIRQRFRVIAFGLYPFDEQWRAAWALGAVALAIAATFLLGARRLAAIAVLWVVTGAVFVVLMGGGVFGLTPISSDRWGGLPLSLYVFLGTVLIGFPLAVCLALGRISSWPLVRLVCTTIIEGVRAVPLLTVLFCAAVVLPLLIPGWFNPAKIYRVILAMAVFYACYQAEVIRGGLQGIPHGQFEAAFSLGLSRAKTMMLVVLPQALRVTIPATMNLIVIALKDTSMVVVVGLFDFLASANTALASDAWAPHFGEVYILIAVTFLCLTSILAALGRWLDRGPAHG